ncbi:MAG TPA: heparan-alpha-glucosaminide N-acetyltransferase domain-containing protein [Pyrinomonadaceae bacterium]|nr:heparan-alpha-glucosaminide N-acetyltransferase domain-containing protein [Pyrinomonadaceae bacterium]
MAAIPQTTRRIDSIDLLRGIVMVIMMLDHTRDFIHNAALQFDATDLSRTNIALFLTRWITHFCAPVFVFLAGTSACLQLARGKSKTALSRFLVTRGLWLIFLELTVVKLGVFLNPDIRFLGFLQVIWVIGVSMIVLAGLIYLPKSVIAVFGLLMITLHNLLDTIRVEGWHGPGTPAPGLGEKLWIVLHQPFFAFPIVGEPSPVVAVVYPLIPWIGVMAAGYAFGALYQMDAQRRRRLLLMIGGAVTAVFIAIRAINIYGDPNKWSQQKNFLFTALSFVNTTKYPPSLLFLLMTLGPAILALALFETRTSGGPVRTFFVTFGRVPLFFYLLQWYTAHLISIILHLAFGKPANWLWQSPLNFGQPQPGVGFNLVVVYVVWIAGVLLLYPLCRWFAGVKQRRKDWWLSYL